MNINVALIWEKWPCRCDCIKGNEVGRDYPGLPRWALNTTHKRPYKREGALTQAEEMCDHLRQRLQWWSHKPVNSLTAPRSRKKQEYSPSVSCSTNWFWASSPTPGEDKFLLFTGTESVVICCSLHRKVIRCFSLRACESTWKPNAERLFVWVALSRHDSDLQKYIIM